MTQFRNTQTIIELLTTKSADLRVTQLVVEALVPTFADIDTTFNAKATIASGEAFIRQFPLPPVERDFVSPSIRIKPPPFP